ncbi:UvrB/UvrC motif-containing protein [Clostridium thailandense]|uniref:UvrB/UvrC motif-containing protein n=1 Tax=Clostridium thailandense TaxID=2794346 RepID=UPI003988E51A
MLCELCKKNEASVHITKILNGHRQELNICEKCAKEKGEFNFYNNLEGASTFSFQNILSGMMDYIGSNNAAKESSYPYCENCGTSYTEFKQRGLTGCSECYKNFNETMYPIIKRVQGNVEHTGKIPKKLGKHIIEKKKLLELKENLQKAIVAEEYEKAAQLRDLIKEIQDHKE